VALLQSTRYIAS
jgi:hypothetical protein